MKFRDTSILRDPSSDLAKALVVTLHGNGALTTNATTDTVEPFRHLVEQTLRIRQAIEIVDLEVEPDWYVTDGQPRFRALISAPIDDREVLVLAFRVTLDRVDDGLVSHTVDLHRKTRSLQRHLRGREDEVSRWIGSSSAHEAIVRKVELAATTRARVVILGPPGVGRMSAARSIIARRGRGSVTRSIDAALRFEDDIWVTSVEAFERLHPEDRHRLEDLRIDIPPLRERIEDGIAFAEEKLGRELKPAERQAIEAHDWPGNFRELEHAIWQLETLSIPLAEQTSGGAVLTEDQLRDLEKQNIERALDACDGTVYGQNGAAAMIGINPTTLASRIKSLGIEK